MSIEIIKAIAAEYNENHADLQSVPEIPGYSISIVELDDEDYGNEMGLLVDDELVVLDYCGQRGWIPGDAEGREIESQWR